MDANRFDAVARVFAQRRLSRRAALRGAGLAAALGAAGPDAAQEATPAATPGATPGTQAQKPEIMFVQSFASGSLVPKGRQPGHLHPQADRRPRPHRLLLRPPPAHRRRRPDG